jgi:hypothetical protein
MNNLALKISWFTVLTYPNNILALFWKDSQAFVLFFRKETP